MAETIRVTHRYDDIIRLPHHVSAVHPPMPRSGRAAQFSPFAALSGYDAAILEAGRLTEPSPELDEERKAQLDATLRQLLERVEEGPEAAVTWFRPDLKKEGGHYRHARGRVRKWDTEARVLLLEDGTAVPIDRITELEALFPGAPPPWDIP